MQDIIADIVRISSKSLAYTSDAEVVPDDDSGFETPPSNPSSFGHNGDHFDKTNSTKDIEVSLSTTHSVLESQVNPTHQMMVMGNANLEIGTAFGCGCANCG